MPGRQVDWLNLKPFVGLERTDAPELTIDLGGGKTLFATMGAVSAKELGFAEGDRACALIKATHVTLFAT